MQQTGQQVVDASNPNGFSVFIFASRYSGCGQFVRFALKEVALRVYNCSQVTPPPHTLLLIDINMSPLYCMLNECHRTSENRLSKVVMGIVLKINFRI
jgi:hypothetical protein